MALTVFVCVLAGSIHGTYSGATLCGCGNTLRQLLVEARVGGYACDARVERESEREREKRTQRMREARSDVGLLFVGGPRNRGNLTRCCAATSHVGQARKKAADPVRGPRSPEKGRKNELGIIFRAGKSHATTRSCAIVAYDAPRTREYRTDPFSSRMQRDDERRRGEGC